MKKITLFLASSNELKAEREQFEIEIYRKCKAWFDKGIFLYLDIWEDLSARMAAEGSQSEYNKKVQAADLFILLVYSKVGMYTTPARNLKRLSDSLKPRRSRLFLPILKRRTAS